MNEFAIDPWSVQLDMSFGDPPLYPQLEKLTLDGSLQLKVSRKDGSKKGDTSFPATLPLHIPHIKPLQTGTSVGSQPLSPSLSFKHHPGRESSTEDEDVWNAAAHPASTSRKEHAKTWERFSDQGFVDRTMYLSEAGPRAWDAALLTRRPGRSEGGQGALKSLTYGGASVASQEAGLKALLMLGMGLDCPLFSVDGRSCVRSRTDGLTISGLSPELTLSVATRIAGVGIEIKALDRFVADVRTESRTSVTKTAIAEGIHAVVTQTKRFVIQGFRSQSSIIQLQELFRRPSLILQHTSRLVRAVASENIDEKILDLIFEAAEACQPAMRWGRDIFLLLLKRASQPWLEAVSALVGLRSFPVGQSGVYRRLKRAMDERSISGQSESLISQSMPAFVGRQFASLVFETQQALQLLKNQGHSSTHASAFEGPMLEWSFTWHDIEDGLTKAAEHEESAGLLCDNERPRFIFASHHGATRDNAKGEVFDPYGKHKEQPPLEIVSRELFDHTHTQLVDTQDHLDASILKALSDEIKEGRETAIPPTVLLPSLSFIPLLITQERLASVSLLRSLFQRHQLRQHLSILHAFCLFGSGNFAVRLTDALLSPDMAPTESRRKQRRTSASVSEPVSAGFGGVGLRLGARSTWPPASSELRLALRSILEDAYREEFPLHSKKVGEHPGSRASGYVDLSARLSFAIRPLPDDSSTTIAAIRNPQSIKALDFLQVAYDVPALVETVITPRALETYDSAFANLLRLLRVFWASKYLVRSDARDRDPKVVKFHAAAKEQRTRIEAHDFAGVISAYCTTQIASIRAAFMDRLIVVERQTFESGHAPASVRGAVERARGRPVDSIANLHDLQELHEAMLRDVRSALLLRRRQKAVRAALDNVLQAVLELSYQTADLHMTDSHLAALTSFHKLVEDFLSECVQLQNREQNSELKSARGAELLVEHLEIRGWVQS